MVKQSRRLKGLFAALAVGELDKARAEGSKALKAIQDEIEALDKETKLVRNLLSSFGGALGDLPPKERGPRVRKAALRFVEESGRRTISPQEVVDFLAEREAVVLGVRRPASLAATVLTQMAEFQRLERNKFKFVGKIGAAEPVTPAPSPPEDPSEAREEGE